MSSERSEARRKLRECTGLVDSLMYVVQSQINRKDVDNKVSRQLLADKFFSVSVHLHIDILNSPAVGGELRLSLEESVLSGAPRSSRL